MTQEPSPSADGNAEIPGLIESLLATEQRLVMLTGGEVDAIADSQGRTFLLSRAQEQLRQAEAGKQAAILNALPTHIALLDFQGCIVSVNEAWRQFCRANVIQSPGYCVGLNYLEICDRAQGKDSSEARRVAEGIRAVLAGKDRSFSIEYPCHSPTEQRWFVMTVTPLAEDGPKGAVVMHLDITGRKEAEIASTRLATIVEYSDDAIIGKDVNSIVNSWNKGAEKIFGHTAHEMVGTSALRLIPPQRQDEERQILEKVRRNESVEHHETLRWTKDGRLINVSVTVSPIKDAGGEVVGLASVTRDITQRMRIEAALHESDNELRAITESMPQLIWKCRPDGWNVYFNQRWVDYTGLTREESYGHGWTRCFHPDDRPRVADAWKNAVDNGAVYDPECRLRDRDGAYRWFLIRGVAQRNQTGAILWWFGTCTDIEEQKRAESALQRQQTELRVLFDLMPAMIWFKDTENGIVRVNKRVADAAGKSVEEIEGKPSVEIYPEEAARYYSDDLEVIRSGIPKLGIVEILPDRAGKPLWVQTDKVPVCDQDGKVVGIVVMAQDISDRKNAEGELREKDALLRIAGGITHTGGWVLEVPSEHIFWSDEVFDILDFPRGNVPPLPEILALYTDAWREKTVAALSACMTDGTSFDLEVEILTAKRRRIWVRVCGEAKRRADGSVERVQGAFQDITERNLVMEALRISEKRFKALFEQAAVGVAQIDATTEQVLQINQRYCQILGRSREEIEQLTFSAITHPDDVATVLEMMQQLKEGAIREFTQEKRYLKKDGSEVWAHVTISAMWALNERPDFFLVIGQDISARKLLEDQFRQAQKMEAVGTLAGGIAHDFNNILAAINGYAELCRMLLTDNPEVRKNLGAILQASSRATNLVRQILAFSRQQKLERRPIQLLAVLAESLTLLRATIPSTIEFETSLPTNAPTVLADATQIHQILMNLGTNAWHAMTGRPGRLKVSLERYMVDAAHGATQSRLRPGLYARVSVSDNGTGMDQATQRRIFEPFFTTKPAGQGTGLGLSVVHGIMDSHEGTVTVYSQPGEGTVFHLYFPAHSSEPTVATPEDGPVPRGNGQRILFVDDEELLVALGRKGLTALGYEVESTTQPSEALALVRADPQRFALVITDQTMPGMTGLSLASQLQQIRPGLPIILTTGYTQALTPQSVDAAGLRQVLLKPFTFFSLGSAVRDALSSGPSPKHIYGTNLPF